MNTNLNTATSTSRTRRIGTAVRHAWDDAVAGQRALRRLTPYYDVHREDGR